MPDLNYDSLNINDPNVVSKIVNKITELSRNEQNFHELTISNDVYFFISENQITNNAGWYIIIGDKNYPLYVGRADNLNKRLNTQDGSRDNFLNRSKSHLSKRNFIKKYKEKGIITKLLALVISEENLLSNFEEIILPLTSKDRKNVEKIIDIFRSSINN